MFAEAKMILKLDKGVKGARQKPGKATSRADLHWARVAASRSAEIRSCMV